MTLVTVIIPARNEEAALSASLTSVLDQTFPLASIEVVVVDGNSTDSTPIVAKQILDGTPLKRWAVLTNPEASTPSNLNLGLKWADGDVIVRVDARSVLPPDYVERTLGVLADDRIAVVGGRQHATPGNKNLGSRSIARALNNPLANGGARYRDHRAPSGPCDTAYLGVFRTTQLRAVDGWNLEFSSNQDFELSRRMSRFGTIWYEAGLPVAYRPRSTFGSLFEQYRRFGRWKATYWSKTGDRPQPRQLALLVLPGVALISGLGALIVTPAAATRLALAGISGILAIDRAGQDRSAPLAERFGSATAMATIGMGWWSGAVQEAMSRGKRQYGR